MMPRWRDPETGMVVGPDTGRIVPADRAPTEIAQPPAAAVAEPHVRCGAQDWLDRGREEPYEFTCQRPDGHDAPHRDRSRSTRVSFATAWEWWPETWWNDDADTPKVADR